MYRRILVPIDGSAASMMGLAQAIKLAKDQRARLCVLHVVDDLLVSPALMDPAGAVDLVNLIEIIRGEGQQVLAQAVKLAARAGVKAQKVQKESDARRVSEMILDEARRYRADLIVMGTHGRRGLNRLVLGSDAERVIHETPVPVLLCRLDATAVPAAAPKRAKRPRRPSS